MRSDLTALAAPLYAELAAARMRLALMKLIRKADFDPNRPRVPAGSPEGGRWTDAGFTRLAGAIEEEEPSRRTLLEDPVAELRQQSFNNSIRALRRLEPENPNLQYITDGSPPRQSTVDAYSAEVESARLRMARRIAGGHAFKHANEFGVSSKGDFAAIVLRTISSPFSQVRDLSRGRALFYDMRSNTLAFVDPSERDGGTMFRPTGGQRYVDRQE